MSNHLPPRSILEGFVCSPECPICEGAGIVCENHPDRIWRGIVGEFDGTECCGGAGAPCPNIAEARATRDMGTDRHAP